MTMATNLKSFCVIFPGFIDKRDGILAVLMQPESHTRHEPAIVLGYCACSRWYLGYDCNIEVLDLGVEMLVIISEVLHVIFCNYMYVIGVKVGIN